MIATDKRKAIFLLHQEGMQVREIVRKLGVSRNTVRDIIQQGGVLPARVRTDKKRLDEELLRRLYHQCQGRVVRVHEKLMEEEGIAVCYPTLTQMLRELGISTPQKVRCQRVPDEPGLEMQHDTSLYQVELAGQAADPDLGARAAEHVRKVSPAAEVVCYDGGMADVVLLIGVE